LNILLLLEEEEVVEQGQAREDTEQQQIFQLLPEQLQLQLAEVELAAQTI
jgi:hypothetical protein